MRGSTAIAAASHAIASSQALLRRDLPGMREVEVRDRPARASSGSGEARARILGREARDLQALATVSRSAAAPRSAVLAVPLRVPK